MHFLLCESVRWIVRVRAPFGKRMRLFRLRALPLSPVRIPTLIPAANSTPTADTAAHSLLFPPFLVGKLQRRRSL